MEGWKEATLAETKLCECIAAVGSQALAFQAGLGLVWTLRERIDMTREERHG